MLRSFHGSQTSFPLHDLLEQQWRSTDALGLKVDCDLHAVGYAYEGDAAIHPESLAIKRHGSLNLARTLPLRVIGKR